MWEIDDEVEGGIGFWPPLECKFLNLRWWKIRHRPIEDHIGVERRFDAPWKFSEEPRPCCGVC